MVKHRLGIIGLPVPRNQHGQAGQFDRRKNRAEKYDDQPDFGIRSVERPPRPVRMETRSGNVNNVSNVNADVTNPTKISIVAATIAAIANTFSFAHMEHCPR